MNQRAAQLGCKNTHFNNPNGLPDETHYTTAGDMMKIAKAAWYNPRFRKFVTTQVYEIPPTNKQSETRYLLNHHKMMPGQSYAYDGFWEERPDTPMQREVRLSPMPREEIPFSLQLC